MIYLATDHRGFELKEQIKTWLAEWGYQFEDMGNSVYDAQDDYPDFINKAAGKVAADPENSKAIILGGSGQGEAMAANRFKGVRAAVYYGGSPEIIKLSREHNNANILSIGASFVAAEELKPLLKQWLEAPFPGEERHARRIAKF